MKSTFKSFLNVFAIMIVLFVWLCMKVEGLRNLKEEQSLISSVVESLVKQRAYSGPSHRGKESQKGSHALTVTYSVTNRDPNSAGGIRFTNEVGINYTKQTLANSTNFIWAIFQQTVDADKKQYTALNCFVENNANGYIAYTVGNEIHLGTSYIQSYSGNIKTELTGIIFHEATHVWQWFGNSSTPGGLIEGIADYVRLKAGYAVSNWARNGQGSRWDEGYSVTARFLDYCNGLRNGFVADLNKKMRSGYTNNFFVELLGKTPDQLFVDYKAKYNTA